MAYLPMCRVRDAAILRSMLESGWCGNQELADKTGVPLHAIIAIRTGEKFRIEKSAFDRLWFAVKNWEVRR